MKLYHVSPAHYRDEISSEGLDPDKCREPRGRVWFYTEEQRAKAHAGFGFRDSSDVWVVDSEAVEPHWDTPWEEWACYVTEIVPPHLLERLHA